MISSSLRLALPNLWNIHVCLRDSTVVQITFLIMMKLKPFILRVIFSIAVILFCNQAFPLLLTQFDAVHFSPVSFAQSPNHQVSAQTVYYSITGSTANELRSQLNQRGVIHPPNGERYDAYTNWYVRWNYRYQTQASRCRISSANVHTDVKITLPRWTASSSISPALKNKWNRYIQALQVHENGHKQNGIDAGKEVLRTLLSMSAYPTCAQLEVAANAAANQVIKNYSQRDIEYDRLTQHGVSQGAVFP